MPEIFVLSGHSVSSKRMDHNEKSFDFALSTTRQVVSLSTGFLALTITFLNGSEPAVEGTARCILITSWILFLFSIIFGVATMMAMTGNLGKSDSDNNPSIYDSNVIIFAIFEMLSFIISVVLAVAFGILVL